MNENDIYVNFVTRNSIPYTMSLDLVRNESENDPEAAGCQNRPFK